MKKMILILVVVLFSFPVFSQQGLEGTTLNRGNIVTTDSEVIEGQYIVFSKDSIEYYLENSQTRYALGLNQVTEVLEYDGNYANTGLWVGGIVGIGIGVAVALGTEEEETSGFITTTTIQTWPIYVFTAAGSLIGYLIGMAIEDWTTVYSKTTAFLNNFNLKQNKSGGLALSYKVYF